MPVSLTYPGVYVEEIPSGIRTIMGVSTSVTAFVGYTKRGPLNKAQEVLSFADFERKFGGLSRESDLSYAVQHFFLNGGERAIVIRVTKNGTASKAGLILMGQPNPPKYEEVLKVEAKEPGEWANGLSITVDYETAHPDSTFNLSVLDKSTGRAESHMGLSMNPDSRRNAEKVIGSVTSPDVLGVSKLIKVEIKKDAFGKITDPEKKKGKSISGSEVDLSKLDKDHLQFMITLKEEDGPRLVKIYDGSAANKPGVIKDMRDYIVNAVKALGTADAYSKFTCPDTGKTLTLVSGEEGPGSFVRVTSAETQDVAGVFHLGVANGGREIDSAAHIRPAPTGSISGSLDGLDFKSLFTNDRSIRVSIDGDGPHSITLFKKGEDAPPRGPKDIALLLQRKIRAIKPGLAGSTSFLGTSCKALGKSIQIISGAEDASSVIKIENDGTDTSADDLYLTESKKAIHNIKGYTLGTGKTLAGQSGAVPGKDGSPPEPKDYEGSEEKKTGIYALLDVDIFNLLCLPGMDKVNVLTKAAAFCKRNRAFLIADCPKEWMTFDDANDNLSIFDPLRSENAALYFPWVMMADPLEENRLREFPPCGIIAGIFARTDSTRGVWKAPAGQDATLTGVNSLVYRLTDRENGLLNPLGLNCLRTFPIVGSVVWGARTLQGADVLTSEWKYIPIRRTALYIEESLFRALKWVVFEPNDEPLWAQIRLNVGAFMHDLFRKGAFQGQTSREAYFVKCDKETTTQTDRNSGIVNILVGFAPLKPAEFVIIKIQQIAGQIQT